MAGPSPIRSNTTGEHHGSEKRSDKLFHQKVSRSLQSRGRGGGDRRGFVQ